MKPVQVQQCFEFPTKRDLLYYRATVSSFSSIILNQSRQFRFVSFDSSITGNKFRQFRFVSFVSFRRLQKSLFVHTWQNPDFAMKRQMGVLYNYMCSSSVHDHQFCCSHFLFLSIHLTFFDARLSLFGSCSPFFG